MEKKLMVANWKMNQSLHEIASFFHLFNEKYTGKRDAWIASQAIHFPIVEELKNQKVKAGLQNCSSFISGAYTGEISARSLKEMNGEFVILGHSERRQLFHETSSFIKDKIQTVLSEDLRAIYCVGESFEEREAGQTFDVLKNQLIEGLGHIRLSHENSLIIAYEPVWAIGTGKTATPELAQEVHHFIKTVLMEIFGQNGESIKILYGGSVKPSNVEELLKQKDIHGALVGGASLKAEDFLALCADS